MSDAIYRITQEPTKSIVTLLIDYYNEMKALEGWPHKQSEQTAIATDYFETLIQREKKSVLEIAQKLVERSELQDKLIKAQAEQIDTVKELVTSVKSLFGMS